MFLAVQYAIATVGIVGADLLWGGIEVHHVVKDRDRLRGAGVDLNHSHRAVHNLLGVQIKTTHQDHHLEAPHQRMVWSHMEMALLILLAISIVLL